MGHFDHSEGWDTGWVRRAWEQPWGTTLQALEGYKSSGKTEAWWESLCVHSGVGGRQSGSPHTVCACVCVLCMHAHSHVWGVVLRLCVVVNCLHVL